MIKDIKITTAKNEELLEILKIKKEIHRTFVEQRPDIYKESDVLYTSDFVSSFFTDKSKDIIVAKCYKKIVGYAFVQTVNIQLPMMIERTFMYINDLAVSEDYRNQGIASLLLKHIEEMARGIGATKIELAVHTFSDDALQLYNKSGYKPRSLRMEKEI